VKSPAIFAIAKASLERNQRTSEIPVFVEAAEESTRKDLASMWFDPADQRASHTPYGFVELGGLDHLIPDSWYELALAKCRNALFHAELRHLRARTHGNWDEALRACDDLLKLSPTTYSFTFYRAEAHRALGHDDDARKDLAAFLAHALDDIHYQTAVQMQKNLGSGPAKIAAP
jgi:tetratricopeptide (TPR) repeat protein